MTLNMATVVFLATLAFAIGATAISGESISSSSTVNLMAEPDNGTLPPPPPPPTQP